MQYYFLLFLVLRTINFSTAGASLARPRGRSITTYGRGPMRDGCEASSTAKPCGPDGGGGGACSSFSSLRTAWPDSAQGALAGFPGGDAWLAPHPMSFEKRVGGGCALFLWITTTSVGNAVGGGCNMRHCRLACVGFCRVDERAEPFQGMMVRALQESASRIESLALVCPNIKCRVWNR